MAFIISRVGTALREMVWYYFSSEIPWETTGEDDLDGRLKRLNEWYENQGGTGSGRVRQGEMRAGIFATTAVSKGGAYLEMPVELLLTREAALASSQGLGLHRTYNRALALVQHRDDAEVLALSVLLCSYLLSGGAPKAYVEALPRDFSDHPLITGGLDDNTAFAWALRDARASLRSFVALCRCAKDETLPDLPRCQYVWAYLIWTTRIISLYVPETEQTEMAFVPLVDMTNCVSSLPESLSSRTILLDGKAVIRTPTALPEGSEICENYGWANFDYFLYHGFFHPDLPSSYDTFVCRPVSLKRGKNPLLDALLGAKDAVWWYPRLCEDMGFSSGSLPDFHAEWPFPRFNAEWRQHRNHAFLVAVALEAPPCESEAILKQTASPTAIAAAWRRLADLVASEIAAMVESASAGSRRREFYEVQIRLGRHLLSLYRSRMDPPPYAN